MANESPRSYRITDDTNNKFKEIAADFSNQQEAMAKLIETYEFQKGKMILVDKKDDIESFEKYVTLLTRMFMSSLEDNQNITETVRGQFEAQLISKDSVIQDLQQQITIAKQLKEDATLKSKTLSDENLNLNNTILKIQKDFSEKISNLETMMRDKDNLNKALTDSCNELKDKMDIINKDYQALKEKSLITDRIISERNSLAQEISDLEKEIENYKTTVSNIKQHESDAIDKLEDQFKRDIERIMQQSNLELDKALLEQEKKHQQQIQDLKDDRQKEVDKYQEKYFNLLENINYKSVEISEVNEQ